MDSSYIVITATEAETISDAFDLSGEAKIISYGLVEDETVTLLEEEPGGTYVPAINLRGLKVQLNASQPSQIIVGYGSYKLEKSVTAAEVAAAVISA